MKRLNDTCSIGPTDLLNTVLITMSYFKVHANIFHCKDALTLFVQPFNWLFKTH